jgi:ubiquinone/menaquinone biosynthesis C-methylase UbiE
VTEDEAFELLRPAVSSSEGGLWADLGAGEGIFTRALARTLGPAGRIYAIDRDRRAPRVTDEESHDAAEIITVVADFTRPLELPGARAGELDGMILANALHYVPDPQNVLTRLASWLRPGGRLVLIEYDRREANRWVPHPIDAARLPGIVEAAGFSRPRIVGRRPSAYGGDLYVAIAERSATS